MMTARRSDGRDLTFRRLRLCSGFCSQPPTIGLASNFHLRVQGYRKVPDSVFGKDNIGNDLKPTYFSRNPAGGVGA